MNRKAHMIKRPLLRVFGSILLLLALASCQIMKSSQKTVTLGDGTKVISCSSTLGSYSLAYSTVAVEVMQYYKDGVPVSDYILNLRSPRRHPDNNHRYCLDFGENGFSQDKVKVFWGSSAGSAATATTAATTGTSNDLLAAVMSKSIDNTALIFQKIIRAIYAVVSGNAQFDPSRNTSIAADAKKVVKTFPEFDPFRPDELVALNEELESYGFCVSMGEFTHADHISGSNYCNNTSLSLSDNGKSTLLEYSKGQALRVDELPEGILYRPRQQYQINIYSRNTRPGSSKWILRQSEYIGLENISPIISLGVTRAMFAEKRIVIAFDNGDLVDFCVAKGSEAKGAIEIPLEIVSGLIALPGQTIVAQINKKNGKQELLAAQNTLIGLQNDYIKFLINKDEETSIGMGNASSIEFDKSEFNDDVSQAGLFTPDLSDFGTDPSNRFVSFCSQLGSGLN